MTPPAFAAGATNGSFMSNVELKSVRKRFGETEIIHGIDLNIESEEFTVFVGPSAPGHHDLCDP